MQNHPSIFISTEFKYNPIVYTTRQDIISQGEQIIFNNVLNQIEINSRINNFVFMNSTFDATVNTEEAIELIRNSLLTDKQATLYAKVHDAYFNITLSLTSEAHGIELIVLQPFVLKDYDDIGPSIDTDFYIKTALKFTENLIIYSFAVNNF